jgi:hypothetical protein
MSYPHVTQFETLDLRRQIELTSPGPVRSAPRRARRLRARLRRRAAAGCVTSA